jgi:MarR family 2-MHQ and catechol resistance regulon transcriptional repressor
MERMAHDRGSRGVDDIALTLWVVLARAFGSVERHSRASVACFGLSTTEFGVLDVLYHKGELAVCEVRRRILVESSSMTYVVDKLVAGGLVARRSSRRDRRVILLALTSRGRELVKRVLPRHTARMRHAVGALSPSDQARAVRLLRKLGLGAADRPTSDVLAPRRRVPRPSPREPRHRTEPARGIAEPMLTRRRGLATARRGSAPD